MGIIVEKGQIWVVKTDNFNGKVDFYRYCEDCGQKYYANKFYSIPKNTVIEIRYPCAWHFRTIDNEYFHATEKEILDNCLCMGIINPEVIFANNKKLKEILDKNLFNKYRDNRIIENRKEKIVKINDTEEKCPYCNNSKEKVTLEISKYHHDFLVKLLNEIKTQDNYATALPVMFAISEEHTEVLPIGIGDLDGYFFMGDLCLSNEIDEYVIEYIIDNYVMNDDLIDIKNMLENLDDNDDCDEKAIKNWVKENPSEFEKIKEKFIEDNDITEVSIRKTRRISEKWSQQKVFFTEKACMEYIESQKHNLDKPEKWVIPAGNIEINRLLLTLNSLKVKKG